MTWKTHLIGGVAACAGTVLLCHKVTEVNIQMDGLVPVLIVSGVSALLPDVDEIRSKAGRALLPVSLIFFIIQSVIKIVTVFTFGKLRRKIKENTAFLMHHGICHYPITILFTSTAACIAAIVLSDNKRMWLILVAAFTIGLLSHIILDIVSGKIALFFPISKKRMGIKLIETSGALETMIVRPALLILCITLITRIMR